MGSLRPLLVLLLLPSTSESRRRPSVQLDCRPRATVLPVEPSQFQYVPFFVELHSTVRVRAKNIVTRTDQTLYLVNHTSCKQQCVCRTWCPSGVEPVEPDCAVGTRWDPWNCRCMPACSTTSERSRLPTALALSSDSRDAFSQRDVIVIAVAELIGLVTLFLAVLVACHRRRRKLSRTFREDDRLAV